MNKNLSNADFLKIFGPFVALIALGMGALIVNATRAPEGGGDDNGKTIKSAADAKSSRLANAPRWQREAEGKDYGVIQSRPMFGAVATETKSARQLPPPVLKPMAVDVKAAAATPPAPQGPAADKIAVVGMVRLDGETQAVVEDLGRSETKFVAVGGEAYGYRLLTIGNSEATLTKNGKQYVVAIGENKPEPKRVGPGPQGPGGGGPPGSVLFGGPGGPGGQADGVRSLFQNMTDEQRQQMRDRIRSMSDDERRQYFQDMRSQGGGGGGAPPGQSDVRTRMQFVGPPPGN